MHERISFSCLRKAAPEFVAAAALILMLTVSIAATLARAQDYSPPNPDSAYQNDNSVPNTDMSGSNSSDDGQSVSVPIPGGGEVTADGPASDQQQSPLYQNWSTDTQQPNPVGGVPIGPQ